MEEKSIAGVVGQDASSLSVMMVNVSHISFYPAKPANERKALDNALQAPHTHLQDTTNSGGLGFIKPATSASHLRLLKELN